MNRRALRTLGLVILLGLSATYVVAEEAVEAETAEGSSVREMLDAIRNDVVQLRLEKALAAIEALLGDPSMVPADRTEALVLRAQAHVAFGNLDAAERDYGEILQWRPGYRPEESLTPQKAMQRFEQAQARVVGWVRIRRDPTDARILVAGRPVLLDPEGRLPLLSGRYRIYAEANGFDSREATIEIQAGEEMEVDLQLTPNARSVVLTVEPGDVDVFLDGALVGRAVIPQGSVSSMAELTLENLPLGEHLFELRKDCYRSERRSDILTVDLLDRAPKRYEPVYLIPSRSTLTFDGGPEGAEVYVDDERLGQIPLDPVEACPGPRSIEVRYRNRTVWRSEEQLPESSAVTVHVGVRPNAALFGATAWPPDLREFAATFNHVDGLPLPSNDLSTPAGWRAVGLPDNTDLALAVVPASREGARDRWYLYSPILLSVTVLDVAPGVGQRPTWVTTTWGLSLADSAVGGRALVVDLRHGGPASAAGLAPGDRIVSIDGAKVSGTSDVLRRLRAASVAGRAEVEWVSISGETDRALVRGARSPRIDTAGVEGAEAIVRAAWAVVDSLSSARSASALANLALLFSEFGHHDLAAETWRRVRWEDRPGVGNGTVQYYLARDLERLGREKEAVSAYRQAASGQATAFDDDGPAIRPAALDRLADLGVRVE